MSTEEIEAAVRKVEARAREGCFPRGPAAQALARGALEASHPTGELAVELRCSVMAHEADAAAAAAPPPDPTARARDLRS